MKEIEFKEVRKVTCKSVPDKFEIVCTIEDRWGDVKKVSGLYGYIASEPLIARREVNESSFWYGVDGKGACRVKKWFPPLEQPPKKVLDCWRE